MPLLLNPDEVRPIVERIAQFEETKSLANGVGETTYREGCFAYGLLLSKSVYYADIASAERIPKNDDGVVRRIKGRIRSIEAMEPGTLYDDE